MVDLGIIRCPLLYVIGDVRDLHAMLGLSRLDAPEVFHHVMGWGIERRKIFIKELSRNPWSGHPVLTDKVKREWQNTKYVLSFFGSSGNERKNYLRYVKNCIDQGRRPELVGGGLIRSMGGWSAVLAIRRCGEREVADQRILGDGDFVKQVISGLDDLVKKNLRLVESKLGKMKCLECYANFEYDDRMECVFVDTKDLRVQVHGTVCPQCGLVQGEDVQRCVYCAVGLSGTVQ